MVVNIASFVFVAGSLSQRSCQSDLVWELGCSHLVAASVPLLLESELFEVDNVES